MINESIPKNMLLSVMPEQTQISRPSAIPDEGGVWRIYPQPGYDEQYRRAFEKLGGQCTGNAPEGPLGVTFKVRGLEAAAINEVMASLANS